MRTNPQNVLKAQYKQTYSTSTKLTLLQNDDKKQNTICKKHYGKASFIRWVLRDFLN